ncbi:protein phosphatase 2C domain-containing protein [Chelativorans sp. AA-79]|uniref:PP2C family protein-serine/threonine phosphatase n=1 Tax=Chelativorans sp. AA-79 TaxID=3028735 RepID=UPI0023F6F27F|nr:protein phosphatase 2C domain-containing protein [Chelativorans sp. AA-79]WEX10856.1 protein phosphatase 2C domain-containing protein [Chelativorans sp. AA-79]
MNGGRYSFECFGVSHTGHVRDHNEDRFLLEPESGLWVVADGMGGHEAGEVASGSIVEHLATLGVASSAPDLRARFEDRLARAHSEIRRLSQERGGITIGSTVAALLAYDGQYACLWSGDSRVYLVRDGAIAQISRDHTEVQELLDRGAITEDEAQHWPRRNVITHAVGVADEITIDVRQGQALPGDIFVLGTDGLTGHVRDEEIRDNVIGRSPQEACEHLLELVLSRGATDNVTVVVVKAEGREKP